MDSRDRIVEAAREILDARNNDEWREACRAMAEVLRHYGYTDPE